MATYTTPGVYYERIDATAPAITAIRTDVAGFAGIAVSGPLDTPIPVQSWKQFQAYFGGFTGSGFLAYAVRSFFENGGKRCWVVRVASNDPAGGALAAGVNLRSSTAGRNVWNISASGPGTYGNSLTVSMRQTHQAQTIGWLKKKSSRAHRRCQHHRFYARDPGSLVTARQALGFARCSCDELHTWVCQCDTGCNQVPDLGSRTT